LELFPKTLSKGAFMTAPHLRPLLALAFLLAVATDWAVAVRDPGARPRKEKEVRGAPNPGTLQGYRNRLGQSFYFEVTGAAGSVIWGTGVYTDDSPLATTAVHAGVLRPGQKGVVKVTILPGQVNYAGTTQNGVTSNPYQMWGGSYRIEAVKKN
jgi:hypothetical protein